MYEWDTLASMGAMTFGRFIADRFVNRYQASVVLRFCGILITSGLLLATIAPGLIISTFGFLLIGLGVSSIVSICYSAAGRLKQCLQVLLLQQFLPSVSLVL
ncbi:hypothetical protein [Chryseobacterium indoltheticum]|uniref:hypothetical protein n=1 Tax=Chryseobacterium indoltheticum TaxID=254 RepID=UPI003F498590